MVIFCMLNFTYYILYVETIFICVCCFSCLDNMFICGTNSKLWRLIIGTPIFLLTFKQAFELQQHYNGLAIEMRNGNFVCFDTNGALTFTIYQSDEVEQIPRLLTLKYSDKNSIWWKFYLAQFGNWNNFMVFICVRGRIHNQTVYFYGYLPSINEILTKYIFPSYRAINIFTNNIISIEIYP